MKKIELISGILIVASIAACTQSIRKNNMQKINFPFFSAEAHRGGRGLMPENTIIAMENAMTFDAVTTLEMDTHITKDGEVVVTHDDYLSPGFMLTPTGQEIPKEDAKKYAIYQMDYKLLKTFDNGTKINFGFVKQKKIKSYIPLLADLIDSVQRNIKLKNRKQVFYNIETKCDVKGDNLLNPEPAVFVDKLMNVILKKKIENYVVIQSFDMRTIQIINKQYPGVRTSFLVANKKTYEQNIADLGYKPFILSPISDMVNAELMKKAHADGVKVIPWTVNSVEEMNRLKLLKVDGIITDYPNLF